jgi:hypothetical protein
MVSPRTQSKFPNVSEIKRPWHLSPLVGANLGNLGLVQRSPVSVSPEVQDLVRKLSESVKKHGILSRFSDKESSSSRGSLRKRKYSESEQSSSRKERDNRMGMFTPPSFDLESSSQGTNVSESSLVGDYLDEDVAPNFSLPVAPLAWSHPDGNFSTMKYVVL